MSGKSLLGTPQAQSSVAQNPLPVHGPVTTKDPYLARVQQMGLGELAKLMRSYENEGVASNIDRLARLGVGPGAGTLPQEIINLRNSSVKEAGRNQPS